MDINLMDLEAFHLYIDCSAWWQYDGAKHNLDVYEHMIGEDDGLHR